MKTRGYVSGASLSLEGDLIVSFRLKDKGLIKFINETPNDSMLSIEVKPYRKPRSLDANALLWACLGEIAQALRTDKWSVYLEMLKRYGQFEYIAVAPEAVPRLKKAWREIEEVGERDGMTELICYYGSSTYNTQEFSILLDGVISEMKEMKLNIPPPAEIQRSLDAWAKHTNSL